MIDGKVDPNPGRGKDRGGEALKPDYWKLVRVDGREFYIQVNP